MQPLTLAEQNRLITTHTDMVGPIAGMYRGSKSIPFEDLCAQGSLGLVKAGRSWEQKGEFRAWAYICIENAIIDLIRDWEEMETGLIGADEDSDRVFEWSIYKTPYEGWETLEATPEEIIGAWQELAHARNSLSGALLSLDKRERAVISARFLKDPPQTLESIARDQRISYDATVRTVWRGLRKLKKVLAAQKSNERDSINGGPARSMV